jgi:hypothetical protein
MGVPRQARDKAEGDRDKIAPEARVDNVSESREVDVQDLPRNEAPRHGVAGGPDADPRAGETAAQDRVPSADDITLEATLLQRSTGQVGVDDWRRAERRFQPGVEDEPSPVRGPSADASTGRAVTERERVTDAASDADATDRNPTLTRDDPDAD